MVEGKEGDVQYVHIKVDEATIYPNSMTNNGFDERFQRERWRNGEADLSKGEPYDGPGLKE